MAAAFSSSLSNKVARPYSGMPPANDCAALQRVPQIGVEHQQRDHNMLPWKRTHAHGKTNAQRNTKGEEWADR
jgi:hypothetical protein